MIINKYRIKKAYECFDYQSNNGRSLYWSFILALDWFSSGFDFNGDNPRLAKLRAEKLK
jgi:hypothetical protein